MLRSALGRVSTLVSRARPRGSGLRQLWGRRARPAAAGKRQDWGWRRASSEPGPGAAHYQLVYTCKVGTRRDPDRTCTWRWTALRPELARARGRTAWSGTAWKGGAIYLQTRGFQAEEQSYPLGGGAALRGGAIFGGGVFSGRGGPISGVGVPGPGPWVRLDLYLGRSRSLGRDWPYSEVELILKMGGAFLGGAGLGT